MQNNTRAAMLVSFLFTVTLPVFAQTADPKLEYIAVLSRHGVRAALVSMDNLNQYSSQPWRAMDAGTGQLTAHGWKEMQLMGAYDRQYLQRNGLLGHTSCGDASKFYFRSDSIQRDVDSAHAVADVMFPICGMPVHSVPLGTADPMFPGGNQAGLFDRDAAATAIEAVTGGDPLGILKARAAETAAIQKVLSGDGPPPQKTLLTLTPPAATADRYTQVSGESAAKSSITDALLLEYEEGLPANETAWGRINSSNLPALLSLHEALVDLFWDVPILARARGSDLLGHILLSMRQAVDGESVEGALGKPGDKGLFVFGHDSDFGHFATLLKVTWTLATFPAKATPPGAAMMFEIWRDAAGRRTVRTSVVGQTIAQIHDGASPLVSPPSKAPVFIPGCSSRAAGYPCSWDSFRKVVENAIDPTHLQPEPATLH